MSSPYKIQKIISFFCIASILFLIGCGTHQPIKKYKKTEKKQTQKYEFSQPDRKRPVTQEMTPQRTASMQLVEVGKRHLKNMEYSKASQSFQEAINIDSANGSAYFYLALTEYNVENLQPALEMLDKAEALLWNQEGWADKIERLKSSIYEELGE
ncbi:hypothetical protein KKA47_00390 [bacterium]|nr:hypothetical protein [bacterium]